MNTQLQMMKNRPAVHSGLIDTSRDWGVAAHIIRIRRTLFAATIWVVAGCADPSAPPNPNPPVEEVPASISMNPNSVILAIGDSLQITVSAKNIFGEALPIGSGASVVWQSQTPKTVSVDSTGMLRALKATDEENFVTITAKWTYNGVTASTEMYANVTPTRQPIAGIRVTSTDSARSGWVPILFSMPMSSVSVTTVDADEQRLGMPRIPLTVHDSFPFSNVGIAFLGRFGALVGVEQYAVYSRVIGDFWLHAQSTVYGVMMRDSLRFTGLYPAKAEIQITKDSLSSALISKFSGYEVLMQPCGLVDFKNLSNMPIDIVFDDSTAATKCVSTDQAGNILNLEANRTATRKFPAVGTVRWTVRDPATGTLLTRVSGKITMKVP